MVSIPSQFSSTLDRLFERGGTDWVGWRFGLGFRRGRPAERSRLFLPTWPVLTPPRSSCSVGTTTRRWDSILATTLDWPRRSRTYPSSVDQRPPSFSMPTLTSPP